MANDLNSMSRKELIKLQKDVKKALSTVEAREKKAALAAAEKAAAEMGYSLTELTGKGGKASGPKTPPKYRNPENPDQTWSGRGRRPDWIKAADKAGKSLDDFLI